jgi:hypothetical protein
MIQNRSVLIGGSARSREPSAAHPDQTAMNMAGAFTKLSGMSWMPQQGWAYSGGEHTVAIGGQGYPLNGRG